MRVLFHYSGLNFQFSLAIEQQACSKPCPILPESLIGQIFKHWNQCLTDENKVIEMILGFFRPRIDNPSHVRVANLFTATDVVKFKDA